MRRKKLTAKQVLKKRVLKEIEKLPEDYLKEVRNYIDTVLETKRRSRKLKPDPDKDPILKLIGIADIEPFGHKIDSELYGD
jgi:hypothetical protein